MLGLHSAGVGNPYMLPQEMFQTPAALTEAEVQLLGWALDLLSNTTLMGRHISPLSGVRSSLSGTVSPTSPLGD